MHCKSCDKLLNDYESTRKYRGTTEYIDLCSYCYSASVFTGVNEGTFENDAVNISDEQY